jgi:hypothetical protein
VRLSNTVGCSQPLLLRSRELQPWDRPAILHLLSSSLHPDPAPQQPRVSSDSSPRSDRSHGMVMPYVKPEDRTLPLLLLT